MNNISLSDRDILKKYQTQNNYFVSSYFDDFDPNGYVSPCNNDEGTNRHSFGANKKEAFISMCAHWVRRKKAAVNGQT